MKFTIYLSISFCLLIGINAETSSISFFNIIPKLITNDQSLQDNIDLNQKFPSINLDIQLNANESNCSQDIQILTRDLTSRKTWALKSRYYLLDFDGLFLYLYFSIRCLGKSSKWYYVR